MSIRKVKRSSSKRSAHQKLAHIKTIVFHVAMIVIFVVEVCKFVVAEVMTIGK